MSNIPNPLAQLILSPLSQTQPQSGKRPNFFEALSTAWQVALDRQSVRVEEQATIVSDGGDKISDITKLTAEAAKLSFMSTSGNTSMSESAEALKTMARKG